MAKTQIGKVLEFFRSDAFGIWLRHNMEFFRKIFDEVQLEFG